MFKYIRFGFKDMPNLISKKLESLPDISDKAYKVEEFVINNIIDLNHLRYGCVYQNGNDTYLLIKEENVDFSDFEFLENQKIEDIKIYYGYVPSFILAKRIIETSRTYISWIQKNNIFTLIQTKGTIGQSIPSLTNIIQNEKLMTLFKIIVNNKQDFGNLAYFKLIENIPNEIQDFKLTTLYTTFTYISNEPKDIMIILKGNFVHETHKNVFVNLEMGFSYAFSEKFEEFSNDFKKQNEIYESKNQDGIIEYSYLDSNEKFYIKCSNNETSVEFKNNMQTIMSDVVETMKDYSCVEETLMLGQSKR